jgi:hypothetical protein
MMFNTTFKNISVISWRSVLLVEETGGSRENNQPVASHRQLYHIMLYTSPWSWFELTTSVVIGTDCIGSCKFNSDRLSIGRDDENSVGTAGPSGEPEWPWLYGSWIYNYLCNQCLSPLMLWVRITIRARCTTLCDKVVCDLRQVGCFLSILRFPPPLNSRHLALC